MPSDTTRFIPLNLSVLVCTFFNIRLCKYRFLASSLFTDNDFMNLRFVASSDPKNFAMVILSDNLVFIVISSCFRGLYLSSGTILTTLFLGIYVAASLGE